MFGALRQAATHATQRFENLIEAVRLVKRPGVTFGSCQSAAKIDDPGGVSLYRLWKFCRRRGDLYSTACVCERHVN